MHSFGVTTDTLRAWGDEHNKKVVLNSSGAHIRSAWPRKWHAIPQRLVATQSTLSAIIDRMMLIFPGHSVEVGQKQSHLGFNETAVSIVISNATADVLTLIGKYINELPVTLKLVAINVNNGLITGKIDLTIIGS